MRERAERLLDTAGDGAVALGRRSTWMHRWYVPITAGGLVVLAIVAVFRMETSAADYDPQYMRVIVERTVRLGGSYYENGIHNKGPLEPLVYEIAARVGGDDGFWFVIGFFSLIAATLVGIAAALFAIRSGAPTVVAASVAAMAVAHLTLSESDYAGVLYARNMTVALLATGFAVAAFNPFWSSDRRRCVAVIAVGVATGLAVQTLLTACFTASPVLLWAMWSRRSERVWKQPAWLVMPVVSALALVSAPVVYAITGGWRPFVDGWWVYARFMSTGTGRSLASQFELGADRFVEYYRDRPVLAIFLVVWFVVLGATWRRLDSDGRALRLLAVAWFVGAWLELILSQRYSSHYFSVLAAPTIMMFAVLAGAATKEWESRLGRYPARALLPLGVAAATVFVGGLAPFDEGVEAAADTSSVTDFSERREAGMDGRTHVVRAALDLVSDEHDPVLMWTSLPWPYLQYERVSATRYIWKSFLLGEIYLGNSGPEYVLPGTWERFDDDVDQTDPAAFIVEASNPVDPDTPFATRIERDFIEVFTDEVLSLSFRNDLAGWLQAPASSAREAEIGAGSIELGRHSCFRIDTEVSPAELAREPMRLEFGDPSGGSVAASILIEASGDGPILVESNRLGFAGYVGVSAVPGNVVRMSIVVGARAAVIVLDGWIAGAVAVDADSPVTLVSGAAAIRSDATRTDDLPSYTGC